MKTKFLFIAILFCTIHVSAQIGIGTTSPHVSSILDVSSTTKGFLFPRMTYSDRTQIGNLTAGLMVYQTNSGGIPIQPSGIYFYDGSFWKRIARSDEIGGGGSSGWTIIGDDQYSNLPGNVGIGIANPTSKFHVVGNILQENGAFNINHSTGILQFKSSNVSKGYVQLSGNNLRIGTNAGNTSGALIFRMDGDERMVIDSSGDVGIGTSSPNTRLHVYGGGIKIERPGTVQGAPLSPTLSFEINDVNDKSGGIVFTRSGSSTLAKFLYTNRTNGPDILRIGMSDPDAFDLALSDLGRVGINMNSIASSYEGQLHIRGASGVDELALCKAVNTQSPTIQFHSTDDFGLPDEKEAFIQLSDGDNLRLGTNVGNTTGKIIMRMGSVEHAAMNPNGWMGFGTTNPQARLHLMDGEDADPSPLTGNGYLCLGDINLTNIAIDNNEIMARNSTNPSTLIIQNDGGLVKIGSAVPALGARLHVTDGSGGSLTQHGHVVIGDINLTNLSIDNNEIQARSNDASAIMYLQRFGGQLAIGTPHSGTSSYKVTVDGKILCEELKVALYSNWPDYVFHENYNLKPLHELKAFIETNHHLPNIPKAAEVEKEGIEVGEMNRKLLEKIEELTLYVIQLQEQIDQLKESAIGNR